MRHQTIGPRKALNKAFLKQKPERKAIEGFKAALIGMLDHAKAGESEEYHKNLVSQFLKESGFAPAHYINTKGRNDLVIHTGKDAESPVGVIIEAKRPGNAAEMPKADDLRCKALNELLLYYLRERIGAQNIALKHLVITDLHQWYLFDAATWEKPVAQNKALVKRFQDFETGRLAGRQTDFFYKEVAAPFFDALDDELPVVYFTLDNYSKILRNADRKDDAPLIALHKLLSPQHLLKLPFANDSNSLDRVFYAELLHLIGLEEVKKKGKWLIGRKPPERRDRASLLEAAITQLDSLDKLERVERLHTYGDTRDEQFFHVALELCITWVNRVLFLKLLEAQVVTYHGGSKAHTFLHSGRVRNYDDLNSLFFQVLARKPQERSTGMAERFGNVPYLNSSLFEPTELEHRTLFISNLADEQPLPLHKATVLKDDRLKRLSGTLPALDYLFRFLDAYDFTSEGGEEVQEENKRLINASVLGLIFEKINGYKDGSFFTPGFITMYMCREALRPAVLRRFNAAFEAEGAKACADFNELRDRIESGREARAAANALINGLRICDPAVGSGHFLVSALNELIAIKSELGILSHRNGDRVRHQRIAVENDELVVYDEEEGSLFEYRVGPDGRASAERQQLQETLFHEKQTLIEQCLFGVDINPNSVKICRLRLWIELLKHTYYLPGTQELETLPNIDINIKCGNSLIHRFALDADLGPALRKSKWNMDSYRLAVQTYRHAEDKTQKREMERLIDTIKGDFQVGISQDSKAVRDLNKAKNEYYLAYEKEQLFDAGGKSRLTRKQLEHRRKLEAKINSLTQVVEDLKNNVLFTNAFEWRFEFPEVLDDEGRFTGFDVVIGNPPYLRVRGASLAEVEFYRGGYEVSQNQFDLFHLFLERASHLVQSGGQVAYIIPNTLLANENCERLRGYILRRFEICSIVDIREFVFEGVGVEVLMLFLKAGNAPSIGQYHEARNGKVVRLHEFEQASFSANRGLNFSVTLNQTGRSLLEKIATQSIDVAGRYEVITGIKEYQVGKGKPEQSMEDVENRVFNATTPITPTYWPELRGRNLFHFAINWSDEYISYGPWLAEPRQVRFFEGKRIVVRQIPGSRALVAAYVEERFVIDQTAFILLPRELDEDVLLLDLAILNSKLCYWYFMNVNNEFDALFPKIKAKELKRLPLPNYGIMTDNSIVTVVSKILGTPIASDEHEFLAIELDKLVYRLYDLTAEEIALVEASVVRG